MLCRYIITTDKSKDGEVKDMFKSECACCGKEIEVSQETFDKGEFGESLCDHCESHEKGGHCE